MHFSSKSRSSGWSDKTDSVDATEFSVELPESELCPDCAVFEELLNAVVLSEPDRSSVESLMFPVIAFQFVKKTKTSAIRPFILLASAIFFDR